MRLHVPVLATLLSLALAAAPASAAPGHGRLHTPGGKAVAELAASLEGAPYAWGGGSPSGFDCSGFVTYVYRAAGIDLPRSIPDQTRFGERVEQEDLAEGDLVFFVDTYEPGISHVGIYLGGGRFIHAVDEARGVVVSRLDSAYWSQHYYAGVRVM